MTSKTIPGSTEAFDEFFDTKPTRLAKIKAFATNPNVLLTAPFVIAAVVVLVKTAGKPMDNPTADMIAQDEASTI